VKLIFSFRFYPRYQSNKIQVHQQKAQESITVGFYCRYLFTPHLSKEMSHVLC